MESDWSRGGRNRPADIMVDMGYHSTNETPPQISQGLHTWGGGNDRVGLARAGLVAGARGHPEVVALEEVVEGLSEHERDGLWCGGRIHHGLEERRGEGERVLRGLEERGALAGDGALVGERGVRRRQPSKRELERCGRRVVVTLGS